MEETKIETPIVTTPNMLEKAEAIAKRIEEANRKAEELISRQEQIAARSLLSGRSEAGQIPKSEPVLTDAEYAKRFFTTGVL